MSCNEDIMKKTIILFLCILYSLLYRMSLLSTPAIILTIKPYPIPKKERTLEQLQRILKTPGTYNKKILESFLKKGTYEGIFSTYMGYISISDFYGQIMFPRKHTDSSIFVLITPLIEPIMMIDLTVHHFETFDAAPKALYKITRKKDEHTNLFYWDVSSVPIPANKRISLDTIVLFAKPKNIIIPEGITITQDTPQMILPPIYARKEINSTLNALRVLKIKQFFSPFHTYQKRESDTYYSTILQE